MAEVRMKASECAVLAAERYALVKRAQAELDEMKRLLGEAEMQFIDAIQAEPVKQVVVKTLEGQTTVYLRDDFVASCPAEKQVELMDWLRAHGQGDLVKETVNAATLRSHCKELTQQGAELPPMVDWTWLTKVGYRRA